MAVGAGRRATVDTVDTAVLRPATLLKSRRSIASVPVVYGGIVLLCVVVVIVIIRMMVGFPVVLRCSSATWYTFD